MKGGAIIIMNNYNQLEVVRPPDDATLQGLQFVVERPPDDAAFTRLAICGRKTPWRCSLYKVCNLWSKDPLTRVDHLIYSTCGPRPGLGPPDIYIFILLILNTKVLLINTNKLTYSQLLLTLLLIHTNPRKRSVYIIWREIERKWWGGLFSRVLSALDLVTGLTPLEYLIARWLAPEGYIIDWLSPLDVLYRYV